MLRLEHEVHTCKLRHNISPPIVCGYSRLLGDNSAGRNGESLIKESLGDPENAVTAAMNLVASL